MNGKLCDVLVEEFYFDSPRTGMREFVYLDIWADAGIRNLIASVEGVCWVCVDDRFTPTNYHVYVDPRYDRSYLMKEIEAKIKIGKV